VPDVLPRRRHGLCRLLGGRCCLSTTASAPCSRGLMAAMTQRERDMLEPGAVSFAEWLATLGAMLGLYLCLWLAWKLMLAFDRWYTRRHRKAGR